MARFAPTGTINMSWIYGTNPYWDKMFQSVVIETVGVATTPPSDVLGRVVQPKYITDATSGDLTALVTSSGVVSANLTTPITAKRIKFILTLTTDDSTKTPQVRQFIAKGRELPQVTRVHDCVYQIQNIENHRVENIRAALRTARASSTLIKFADNRYGDTTAGTAGTDYVYVTMMPGYPKEVDVKHLKGQPPELGISVRWLEANYS
jgi:hypothetical protein